MGRIRNLAAAVAMATALSNAAVAQQVPQYRFDLAPQELKFALRAVTREAGLQLFASSDDLRGLKSPGLHADLTVDEALKQLLAGTTLHAQIEKGAVFIRGQAQSGGGNPPTTARADQPDQIVVTGTQIRGASPVGSSLITISRDDIDRSGYATTQQILQALPQNFGGGPNEGTVGGGSRNGADTNLSYGSSINLRGLGSGATLVLLDGNRVATGGEFGAYTDISMIPSSAIERIEVLADGSSALYGSDAVAGVVNIVLRDHFEGAETRARLGIADGFTETQIGQLVGRHWSTGRVVLGYEYYRRGRLPAVDRRYATEDLRPFGGPDFRTETSNPGTIVAGGQTYAIPQNQDGIGLAASELVAGTANLSDGRAPSDLLPRQQRHTGYVSVEQDLGTYSHLTLQGFVGDRVSNARYTVENIGGVSVPSTNPFYVDPTGTGAPVVVDYDFSRDLGPNTNQSHVRTYSAVAAIDRKVGSWTVSFEGNFGEQRELFRNVNAVNYYTLAEAISDPNPATAYNVFGDGSFTNPATIDSVRGYFSSVGRYRLWSGTLKGDGSLISLPGGNAKLAVGTEFRAEHYSLDTTDFEFTPIPVPEPTSGLPIGRNVIAGYAELLLPLVGGDVTLPAINKLDVSVAARVEHYNDFGTTTNPKVGFDWKPIRDITLRASYGTSFRAPGFLNVRQGSGVNQYAPIPLADPQSPTGVTNALLLFGNEPNIRPEKARTWTIGVEFRPRILPGLHVQADYFDIRYRDRILNLAANYPTFLQNRSTYAALIQNNPSASDVARYYSDPSFINPYGIAAADVSVLIDARTGNLAATRQTGMDFDLGWQTGTSTRQIALSLTGAYLFHVREQIAPGAPATDVVNTFGNPVSLRLRGQASATLGRLDASLAVNYVGGYRNESVVPTEHVRSWTTADLEIGYRLPVGGALSGAKLSLAMTNILNQAPPYVTNRTLTSALGYDPDEANAVGRMIALQLTTDW